MNRLARKVSPSGCRNTVSTVLLALPVIWVPMTCRCVILAATLGVGLLVVAVPAEETGTSIVPFGKEPGTWYLGGTSGLSGLDSLRGYIDSLFYAKAAASLGLDLAAGIEKVIYGDDDRLDVYTVTDAYLLRLAQATCIVTAGSEISDNGDGTWDLTTNPWFTQGGLPLCEGERFVGQHIIGYCSGFLVAPDIVVTAGHCLSTCGSYAFLFGFQQVDSLTPPALTVPDDDIYFCSEIIDRVYAGEYDHCVVRLDRPVVGRTPIPISRDELVPNGAPLVVVGHPVALPMKIAAGAEVKDNRPDLPWFQANTDTYGGNSGSMIVNTDTWKIEGILVRGAPDFVYDGGCTASNVVPNTGNPGSGLEFEEISKIGTVAHLIPELVNQMGEVRIGSDLYSCEGQVEVELLDLDLAGLGSYELLAVTAAADSELVTVSEISPGTGAFSGVTALTAGTPSKYDGLIQVAHGDVVTIIYEDADDGTGNPATVEASGAVDCLPPQISEVTVLAFGSTWVTVVFATDEPALGRLWVGESCGDFTRSEIGVVTTSHQITLGSLAPATTYWFKVEAADPAGNSGEDDQGGICYDFTTCQSPDFFTEQFLSGTDLQGLTVAFVPNGSPDFYQGCVTPYSEYPSATDGDLVLGLADDDYERVPLADGRRVYLFGVSYGSVYVGSNGFVTFSLGSTDWSESIDEHFASPARISVFWDDFDPSQGGQISCRQYDNRFTVTWHDVPERSGTNRLRAQLQLFFDGIITITYQLIEPLDGLVGLSRGSGKSIEFVPSDLSVYGGCSVTTCYYDGDNDSYGVEGDPGHLQIGQECAEGYAEFSLDCDDADPTRNPGAEEILDDTIDQDCDGIDNSCCEGIVGDVNQAGGDTPTISDVSTLVDHLFISGKPLKCAQEADVNQSGGRYPTPDDITISDISALIDLLFIDGTPLSDCL